MRISLKCLCECGSTIGMVVVVILINSYHLSRINAKLVRDGVRRKNVLMVIVDDLRPQLDVYRRHGMDSDVYSGMHTPNLDKLAEKSLFVEKAFVQYAVCGPSRASALTSRRPSTTMVYNLVDYWRDVGGNFTTIPQYFKEHGYATKGVGKVFHHGPASGQDNDAISWTEPFYQPPVNRWHSKEKIWRAVPEKTRQLNPLPDDKVLDEGLRSLRILSDEYKHRQQNFFLAVGFYKPHIPWVFPEEFLAHYPLDDVDYPNNPHVPLDTPDIAFANFDEIAKYGDMKATNHTHWDQTEEFPYLETKLLRRAYFASVSYIDHQIGQLLQAVKEESMEDEVIISVWGDHGFLLGEHATWAKHSVFELATRIPMMLHIPKVTNHGIVTSKVVELIDLFPTLAEVAGLPPLPICPENSRNTPVCTQGRSFTSLIEDPDSKKWKNFALSEQARFNAAKPILGQSMRTSRFRFTEWPEWNRRLGIQWEKSRGVELYDLKRDPSENRNLADYPGYRAVLNKLRLKLRNAINK